MVVKTLLPEIGEAQYYLCKSETCDVAYYSYHPETTIKKGQVKVPIWFKEGADPKYICYCNKVTEADIINAVKNEGAENMKDIVKLTGAMKNGNCEINHPTGKCCSPVIQETIDKSLDLR